MNSVQKTRLILIVTLLLLTGCKNWEYDVEKNGILFEKIHQSKGGTYVGFMRDDNEIQGFPCAKGWIHFKEDWRILSCQLSEEITYKGLVLPKATWFHFPYHQHQTGFVLSLPFDYKIQGYVCGGSGGYKGTHTGFYDSGKLRSFFAPADALVDGIPCEASLIANIRLFENGRIMRCKLSRKHELSGEQYSKGTIVSFDENGKHIKGDSRP